MGALHGVDAHLVLVPPPTPTRSANEDIVNGYRGDTGSYIEVTEDELDDIAPASAHTIEIDAFAPRSEVDPLYFIRPYYIVPDGKVGQDAFSVIRETIRSMDRVALARVTLTNRERIIALEARDEGLVGMLLRYSYEVRSSAQYFDDIQDIKITKDMLQLAKHIVEAKCGHFEPDKFEDYYKIALNQLLTKKQKAGNVINLMDALRKSLAAEKGK